MQTHIFVIELEKSPVPELISYIKYWKRYVNYTLCFTKMEYVKYILCVLNDFDNNIEFTFHEENDGVFFGHIDL